jgi:hypothetical protein
VTTTSNGTAATAAVVPRLNASREASVSELLTKATERETVRPSDGKSHSTFERLTIEGRQYFLKCSSRKTDWVTRVSGDRNHRPYQLWQSGIMARLPSCIDHATVAMEVDGVGDPAQLRILMHDVGAYLVPEGDSAVPDIQHHAFIDHLADLSVSFWGWQDTVGGLMTMSERLHFFASANVKKELSVADPPEPIVHADAGWRALALRAPRLAAIARAVHNDPTILTAPLAATPVTFLHGDWKMGNLGSYPDGRTLLLDWALPGSGPACWELCWYLALNRARLPETKEATIARFRALLDRSGMDVSSWFERQLDLCIVGVMSTFGWEKALGDDDELRWWERRAVEAVARQDLEFAAGS